jgi:hypothetical protein
MLWVSRQVKIPIHKRDSRVGSLSEFVEFRQSSRSWPTRAPKLHLNWMDFGRTSALELRGGLLIGREALWPLGACHSPDKATPSYYTKNESFASGISKMWCVSSHFHRRGVFIGPWGSFTDLEKSVWHLVLAGRSGGVASTDFLHRIGLLILV